MPILRLPLIVLAACAVALLTPTAPASAGGPTSALLSVPGEGRTASLYYTDTAYGDLADLVGVEGDTGAVDTSGRSHESGPGVTVTWLIHDVMPWRVDRIYLEGEGAPWIATQVMDSETGSIWDSPTVWHQPSSGDRLGALLDRLGVGEAARAADEFVGVAGDPVPDQSQPDTETPAAATAAERRAGSGSVWVDVQWALLGVVGGVVFTLAWTRARSTRTEESVETDIADWPAPAPPR